MIATLRPLVRAAVLFASLMVPALAADMTAEQRAADFEQLAGILRSSYAMIEYKKTSIGVDFEEVTRQCRAKLATLANDKEFYDLLSAYIATFKDAHLNHVRPSAMTARLGVSVRRIEGRAIITMVDQKALPADAFPFKLGDELLAIDDVPVARILRERRPYVSGGREEYALQKLTRQLTFRSGSQGPVPTGIARLTIRPAGGEPQTVEVPWLVTGRALPGLNFHSQGAQRLAGLTLGDRNPDMAVDVTAREEDAGPKVEAESAPMPIWAPDGQVVPSPIFPATLFDTPKGKMAYVRINTFSVDDSEPAIKEFRRVLALLKDAKGLILDLNDNPGGSVTYGLTVASMFTDKMLALPKKAERANRTTLSEYRGYELSKNERRAAMARYHGDEIEKAMEAGLSITPPMTLFFRPSQAPDQEVRFTKPVLVLINDQSVSCADLVPSVLKDNGLAKTFGSTTAGAGGSVSEFGPLSYSGSSFSVTINVTQRVNGSYIENVGVEADIPCEPTVEDITTGWKSYRKAYTDALCAMVSGR